MGKFMQAHSFDATYNNSTLSGNYKKGTLYRTNPCCQNPVLGPISILTFIIYTVMRIVGPSMRFFTTIIQNGFLLNYQNS